MGRPRRFDSRKVSARGLNPVARWPLQSLPHHLEFVFSRIGLPARSDPLPPGGSAARSHGGGNGIACCKSRGSHPERSTRSARERKLRSRCRNHGAGRGALGRADRPNVKFQLKFFSVCNSLRLTEVFVPLPRTSRCEVWDTNRRRPVGCRMMCCTGWAPDVQKTLHVHVACAIHLKTPSMCM